MTEKKINEMLKNAGINGYASEWNGKRIYINLNSKDRSFAGDRNWQLYFDIASNSLISKNVKGTCTRAFAADVKKVEALFK